jgi:PPM family protein phosphatase
MVVPESRMTAEIRWHSAGLTHRGLLRPVNEDALLLRPDSRIAAVADGMGGHAAGDVASRIAVEALDAAMGAAPPERQPALTRMLLHAFEAANTAILEYAAAHVECSGMGTTLTALAPLPQASQCVIAHVGDSRCYRMRGGELTQATHDHTWVQRQVDAGMLTPLQARHHPLSSVLNRVLGTRAVGPADTRVLDVVRGDLFLLCTDGLTTMVEDEDLQALLAREASLEQHARALVEAANLRGGRDNITVVLVAAG